MSYVFHFSSQRTRDGLVAEIVRERFGAEDAAAASAQVASAVGHPVGEKIVGVDPTVSGNQSLGHAIRALEVGAPNAVGEAVGGTVHEINHPVLVSEGHHVGAARRDLG